MGSTCEHQHLCRSGYWQHDTPRSFRHPTGPKDYMPFALRSVSGTYSNRVLKKQYMFTDEQEKQDF